MTLAVQILVDGEPDLSATLDQTAALGLQAYVGDMRNNPETHHMCRLRRVPYTPLACSSRADARNRLWSATPADAHVFLNAGEMLHRCRLPAGKGFYLASLVNNNLVSHEIRAAVGVTGTFQHRLFEQIEATSVANADLVVVMPAFGNSQEMLRRCAEWAKEEKCFSSCYHLAMLQLACGHIDQFMTSAREIMFRYPEADIPNTMVRYYYALACLHKNQPVPLFAALGMCLAVNPFMAEFWCLAGDAHYHLLNNFGHAYRLYSKAISFGRHRKVGRWPADLDKYEEYPLKMMASCCAILNPNR